MAAVVTNLARLFQPVMLVPGGKPGGLGLTPWYLLLGLRLVALFFANDPWSSAKSDLVCNWTEVMVEEDIQPFCQALCFNQHFSSAVPSVWGLGFLFGLLPVGIMGLIRTLSKHHSKATKTAEEESRNPNGVSHSSAAGFSMATESAPSPKEATLESNIVPSHSEAPSPSSWPLATFVFSVVLLLVTEMAFLWVVIALQVPSVSKTTFLCLLGGGACPKALECVLLGRADKLVALWGLAFTAMVNAAACLAYLLLRLRRVSQCHQ